MSGEGHSLNPALVQSLITSYYVVREPPQLVQQQITTYYPACANEVDEENESVGEHCSARSCYSPSDDVACSTHVAETPTSRLGDIGWYLHSANEALQSRERVVQTSKKLFGSFLAEEGLAREDFTSYSDFPTRSPVSLVSFRFNYFWFS